jgi:hypothetical protein
MANICIEERKCVHSLLKTWPQRKYEGIQIGRSCLQRRWTCLQFYLLATWRYHVCRWIKDDPISLQAFSTIDDEKNLLSHRFRMMIHILTMQLMITSEGTHSHNLYRPSCQVCMTTEDEDGAHIEINCFDMIWYLYLTAVGLTPGGSSTSHIYTQTVRIILRKENCEVRAVPRLCELYPGICLSTEE